MRPSHIAFIVSLLAASCSSGSSTKAQAPIDVGEPVVQEAPAVVEDVQPEPQVDPLAPAPWTGAFTETAVMLADTVRIEGPQGLLQHVAARVDDAFYERTAETTEEGFLQTIVRAGEDAPEIRVRLDRWTMAATTRVIVLERFDEVPVTVTASGDAIWRNVDGSIARSQRLEFVGNIGQDEPVAPVGAAAPSQEAGEASGDDQGADEQQNDQSQNTSESEESEEDPVGWLGNDEGN